MLIINDTFNKRFCKKEFGFSISFQEALHLQHFRYTFTTNSMW